MQGVRNTGDARDFQEWTCAKETEVQKRRYERFRKEVDIDLVSTMQNESIPGHKDSGLIQCFVCGVRDSLEKGC